MSKETLGRRNDDVPGMQGGHEDLFDIGEEARPVDGAVEDPGRGQGRHPQRGEKRTGLPPGDAYAPSQKPSAGAAGEGESRPSFSHCRRSQFSRSQAVTDRSIFCTGAGSNIAIPLNLTIPALGVGEPEPARTELLSADAIFFLERVNDVTLLLVDPARAGHDEELQHLGKRRHTGRAEQRLSAVTNVATRRASRVESARRTASIGFLDSTRSAIIDRPASRTRSSGTSRFSAIDFEVGLAQRKLSNRCVRATCSIE